MWYFIDKVHYVDFILRPMFFLWLIDIIPNTYLKLKTSVIIGIFILWFIGFVRMIIYRERDVEKEDKDREERNKIVKADYLRDVKMRLNEIDKERRSYNLL